MALAVISLLHKFCCNIHFMHPNGRCVLWLYSQQHTAGINRKPTVMLVVVPIAQHHDQMRDQMLAISSTNHSNQQTTGNEFNGPTCPCPTCSIPTCQLLQATISSSKERDGNKAAQPHTPCPCIPCSGASAEFRLGLHTPTAVHLCHRCPALPHLPDLEQACAHLPLLHSQQQPAEGTWQPPVHLLLP